jgi:sugar O-acyltransferase (sialic acid O-acetyltransferase NeuD family)
MKEKILLIGGGGHCKSVVDVIELENKYEIAGIVDKEELIGKEVLGYKVIGSDDNLGSLRDKFSNAIITIGHVKSNQARIKLFNHLKELNFNMPRITSPLAYVSKHAQIGVGTIVMHHALINSNVKVGNNCIINTKALIEHDSIVEDNCHISTAAVVNGGVIVKENTFFGSNSTSKEYIEIDGFIKAGSLVK